MKVIIWFSILFVLLSLCASFASYPSLPDKMASHWDAQGNVNGYMGRFWGAYLMPLIQAAVVIILFVVPKIDPLKKNIDSFKKEYFLFILAISSFLTLVHIQVLAINLGSEIDLGRNIPLMIGFLFILIGKVMQKIKRNFFIGIRTPWTISSDIVWEKTHKIGSNLFILSGAVTLIASATGFYPFEILMITIITTAIISIVYSFLEYRKLPKDEQDKLAPGED